MHRLLVVDDEPNLAALVADALERRGYTCDIAHSVSRAFEWLETSTYSVVVSDLHLKDGDGLQLLQHVRSTAPDVGVIIVSAQDHEASASKVIAAGAYGYLVKPVAGAQLAISVELALKRREAEHRARLHQEELEDLVERRTSALLQTIDGLQQSAHEHARTGEELAHLLGTVCEFGAEADTRHTRRVSSYADLIAGALDMHPERRARLRLAAALHDVGNVALPKGITRKPGLFDASDLQAMQQHTLHGHRLLRRGSSALMQTAADIALSHHERVDGSGYPHGATAEDISLEARVVAVADVYDSMTQSRAYRDAWSADEALRWIREQAGILFDAEVVEALASQQAEAAKIRRGLSDLLEPAE